MGFEFKASIISNIEIFENLTDNFRGLDSGKQTLVSEAWAKFMS